MTDQQIIRRQCEPAPGLDATLDPLLQRIYSSRGIRSIDQLDYQLATLLHPSGLDGCEAAAKLLAQALAADWRLLIVADFDADGATSCALAVRALRAMGARQVSYLVPNRFTHGYGLSRQIVEEARAFSPDLLITVDNGISSIDGVSYARELGIRVLITDHHLPAEQLPEADVIVNPNLPGNRFESKNLAGVGVIFYVMMALRAALRQAGWFQAQQLIEPKLANLLDLVALGTVADVVRLDHNNRILVHQGLQRIRAGHCCAGIKALLAVAGRQHELAVSADMGFAVAPRLNAAGRLEDMSEGIELLLTDSTDQAAQSARSLDNLNRQRRAIEDEMKTQAITYLSRLQLDEQLPYGLALFDESWHQGVIGILASRVKDQYNRPVIAFARSEQGELKGSGRSIQGFHLRDALSDIAARHPGVIQTFGGHAMAAGLTLAADAFPRFVDAFEYQVRHSLTAQELEPTVLSDGALEVGQLTLITAMLLEQGGPWGQGFAEPLFDDCFQVADYRVVGARHLRLRLLKEGMQAPIEAIAFNQSSMEEGFSSATPFIHASYRMDINRYQNREQLQLVINNFRIN